MPDCSSSLGEPIAPEDMIEPRGTRHEEQLEEREEGPDQGGQLADRDGDAADRVELIESAVADPHKHDQDEIGPHEPDHVLGAELPRSLDGARRRRERRAGACGSREGRHGPQVRGRG